MRFRHHDALRLFCLVAREKSFSAAAEVLNLTKGAVSYQIAQLESALGFALFTRRVQGVRLTERGERLFFAADSAFGGLEREIRRLRQEEVGAITIGLSTYFASRWLSPRLMRFTAAHPNLRLRLQPLTDLVDLEGEGIDMAVRWGRGDWQDMEVERLFRCPAYPTVGSAQAIGGDRDLALLSRLPLLQDRQGSRAWADWYRAAGAVYRPADDALVIPDPNVRVQAVIDGQGAALNDALVSAELTAGQLVALKEVTLEDYGYFLAYPAEARERPAVAAFHDWICAEARDWG